MYRFRIREGMQVSLKQWVPAWNMKCCLSTDIAENNHAP